MNAKNLDTETKKLIDETINEFIKRYRCLKNICPCCQKIIREDREYTDDGGKTWRHIDCDGVLLCSNIIAEGITGKELNIGGKI